jgi:hypothetical protein
VRNFFLTLVVLVLAWDAAAAPNVTNAAQKGSLLVFPDIDVRGTTSTLIRISNDGVGDVDVKCVWMDGNHNQSAFVITVTRDQPIWFDARTGSGTRQVNVFPASPSNGYDNPFFGDATSAPVHEGMLTCFAVDVGEQNQVKWNHLSGTATIYDPTAGTAYEYSAYGFWVGSGINLEPVGGAPGLMLLNGVDYDSCPLYQVGQFSPEGTAIGPLAFLQYRLAVVGCTLNLSQDWTPVYTKLLFDVWNADEVKFSGAYDCAETWHRTQLTDVRSAAGTFTRLTLGTDSARYRVQGVKSSQCPGSVAVGLVGIQATTLSVSGRPSAVGSPLAAAGKYEGSLIWDPSGAVPEGGIR